MVNDYEKTKCADILEQCKDSSKYSEDRRYLTEQCRMEARE